MNRSEKFWDRAANFYSRSEQKHEPTYVKIIEILKPYLKSTDVVLDYGCGTGRISNWIADEVKLIYALDTSAKMIAIARRNRNARGIKNVDYVQSSLADGGYKTGSCDVVLVFYTLHVLEDAHAVLKKIHALLKPGGLLITATPCMSEKPFLRMLLTLIGNVGLIPKMRSYTIQELEATIAQGEFQVTYTERLLKTSPEYFVVAKKLG